MQMTQTTNADFVLFLGKPPCVATSIRDVVVRPSQSERFEYLKNSLTKNHQFLQGHPQTATLDITSPATSNRVAVTASSDGSGLNFSGGATFCLAQQLVGFLLFTMYDQWRIGGFNSKQKSKPIVHRPFRCLIRRALLTFSSISYLLAAM